MYDIREMGNLNVLMRFAVKWQVFISLNPPVILGYFMNTEYIIVFVTTSK